MKNHFYRNLILTIAIGLLLGFHPACKKSDDTTTAVLTVQVGDGTKGEPTTGQYYYNVGEQVEYSYELKDRHENLRVYLDDTEVEPAGVFSAVDNHTLVVESDALDGDYLLSVAHGDGVLGYPETGNFYYDEGTVLEYSYSLEEGYTNMVVELDGEELPSSGTILFDQAHTLYVFSDTYYEIRGTWDLYEAYEDGSQFILTVTFSGDSGETGIVTDSDGGVGTYEVSGPNVEFTLEFPDVTYVYTGLFSDETEINGVSDRTTSEGTWSGGWTAYSQSAETSSTSSVSSAKSSKKHKGEK